MFCDGNLPSSKLPLTSLQRLLQKKSGKKSSTFSSMKHLLSASLVDLIWNLQLNILQYYFKALYIICRLAQSQIDGAAASFPTQATSSFLGSSSRPKLCVSFRRNVLTFFSWLQRLSLRTTFKMCPSQNQFPSRANAPFLHWNRSESSSITRLPAVYHFISELVPSTMGTAVAGAVKSITFSACATGSRKNGSNTVSQRFDESQTRDGRMEDLSKTKLFEKPHKLTLLIIVSRLPTMNWHTRRRAESWLVSLFLSVLKKYPHPLSEMLFVSPLYGELKG